MKTLGDQLEKERQEKLYELDMAAENFNPEPLPKCHTCGQTQHVQGRFKKAVTSTWTITVASVAIT